MLPLKDFVEITSDVVGLVSGICLVVPALEGSAVRAALDKARRELKKAAGVNVEDLLKLVQRQQQAVMDYDEQEHTWLKLGEWTLLCTFALKLLYHYLSK